jgi:flagellar basal body-associated protein FliL
MRGITRSTSKGGDSCVTILWIIIIVVIVLLVLGFFSRGRW